ncbi:uncharacterized protein EDB91DRAFT_1117321 [Suillus paluster]|uniref:uncharacterized protein n=1 Tax=Suillus paluster TaxID=48578 RepID=UPI001B880CCD|nr:uncharacterized protein EDB91DRAFT_1117321 [Suillus paluster]KAG1746514.1 hypothetical protein EDB91DRAFT_1117321 [Suillus paluster]
MSARSHKGFSSSHAIPPNPTFLDFPRSDGDPSNWPTNTTFAVDSEGHVNYMRVAALDESLSIKWRVEVGASLATKLNMAQGNYVLQGWPQGYQMYDHNKGPKDNPRHDAYLIEFIPHALWLLTDPTLDRSNCNCKYCNKKPQLPPVPRLKRQPQPLKEKPARDQEKSTRDKERFRPYFGVRRAPKPVKQPAPKQSMLRERHADLSCAYGPEVKVRRWFRDGELLWCALDTPIEGPSGPGGEDSIFFWPGIVEETRMKPTPIPKDIEMGALGGPSNVPNPNSSNSDEEVPWIIRHDLSYKMKLLGISHTVYISDQCVLPYQSLSMRYLMLDLDPDPVRTSTFNPYATSREKIPFAKAAAPYGIALQIGANISGYWAPTDDWEFKFTLDHPNTGPPRSASIHQSLDSVMNLSMAYNANLASMVAPSGSGSHTPSISAPMPPLVLGQTIVQTRYQGLWWGAERIWTDELVRLKFSRGQVAPKGNDCINAPAGPSRKARAYAEATSGQVGGAEGRGVFMRIEGLFVADPPSGRGSKVCHAVGTLYELVDEDWDENLDSLEMVVGKGKGKAAENGSASFDGTPAMDGVPDELLFMTGPSPLRPPPLANPDPAVPIEGTTTDVLSHSNMAGAQSVSASSAPKRDANSALSHPVLSSFVLPKAPDGFKFRPIMKPGTEIVVDLTWIAGRYYPGLLEHRLLDRHVERALAAGGTQLWALEGLTAGCYNAMDPTKWKPTRTAMVREADSGARVALEAHWKNKEKERQEAKLLEDTHLPPVVLSGMDDGAGGSGSNGVGATAPGSSGDGQGYVNGNEERIEWKALANGMLEDNAMSVD